MGNCTYGDSNGAQTVFYGTPKLFHVNNVRGLFTAPYRKLLLEAVKEVWSRAQNLGRKITQIINYFVTLQMNFGFSKKSISSGSKVKKDGSKTDL